MTRLPPTLREVSNLNANVPQEGPKLRTLFAPAADAVTRAAGGAVSPHADRLRAGDPRYCTDIIAEIAEVLSAKERAMARNSTYLSHQPEVNEKMRLILMDWLVDVGIKFKLHPETFFLTVDIIDRYLATTRTTRSSLQLVGITATLIASKYEEIWPPEVRDCVHISANTYTREDILKCERSICAALQYKFTSPTPYPFFSRLLTVSGADPVQSRVASFYLEHAVLDYKYLQFAPSMIAAAAVYLANVALSIRPAWSATLSHYSKYSERDLYPSAEAILLFVATVAASKYQAVRRKYGKEEVLARTEGVTLRPLEA